MKELHDLETYEVSLVPKGANGKQFLVFKNLRGQQGMKDAKEIVDWVTKNQDPETLKKVAAVLKDLGGAELAEAHPSGDEGLHEPHIDVPLSDKAKAALQAIARIASPMKDEVHPAHLMKVLQAAGYDMKKAYEPFGNPDGERHSPDGEPPRELHDSSLPLEKIDAKAIPMDILSDMKDVLKSKLNKSGDSEDDEDELEKAMKSHMGEAADEACKAYKTHMEKLGYRKYPDAEVRMKGVQKDIKQVDISAIAHDDTEEKGMDVSKALDLSKVDPKSKPALEALFKANQEAVAKAARLEKELNTEREARQDKDLMERAKAIGHGTIEKHFKIMKSLSSELRDEYEAEQKAIGEQIKKGKLFEEIGKSGEGKLPGNDAWAKIETMADGLVQKGGDKISKSEAIDAVLKTAEGKRLYDEYMAAKPGMKV